MIMQRIELALKLLDEVETMGKKNLNNLLGAIQVIEGLKQDLAAHVEQENK